MQSTDKADQKFWKNATKIDVKANAELEAMSRSLVEKLKTLFPYIGNVTFVETFKRTSMNVISYVDCQHSAKEEKKITGKCLVNLFRPDQGFVDFDVLSIEILYFCKNNL